MRAGGMPRLSRRGPGIAVAYWLAMAVVLVVNDDDAALDMYEDVLTDLGHEPVTKEIIASGPETVQDVGAEALIVDLQRPNEDDYGIRIIEDLRADEEMGAIPIVLCTGAAEAVESVRPRLDALGVPIVVKPFSLEELERALERALERDQPR
jgi:CheY-like chemotaxis protein